MSKENLIESFQSQDQIPFHCKSKDHSFQITHVTKSRKNELIKIIVYYNIFYFQNSNELSFQPSKLFQNGEEILNYLYDILWNYKLCPECFYLVEQSQDVCQYCIPQKIFWEQKKESIPTCSICFDQVYGNKLTCGHYFHLTCLMKLYPHDDSRPCTCPNCRVKMTSFDKKIFFME